MADEEVQVSIPPHGGVLGDQEAGLYGAIKFLAVEGMKRFGKESGTSIALSAVTRAMRATMSPDEARDVLHKFAESMPEIAKYDAALETPPRHTS